jgi:hypothetical protein
MKMYENFTMKDNKILERVTHFYKDITDNKDKKDAVTKVADCIIGSIHGMMNSPANITEKLSEEFKEAIEFLSDGNNTVIPDDRGIPSIMVKIDNFRNCDLDHNFNSDVHPAFIMDGKPLDCIYVSKYHNFIFDGRGYSFPFAIPTQNIGFEESLLACKKKGIGWNLSYFALRAAIALKASSQGFLPRGNSDMGHDYCYPEEKGILWKEGLVETGSGPKAWSHDNTVSGIYDLCGNLNEWDTGLRLKEGEIQIIPDANCLLEECDYSQDSKWWRAIMPDGSLVMPGCKGSLKYKGKDGHIILTASEDVITDANFGCACKDIEADKGTAVPDLIKQLGMFPINKQWDYGNGWRWANTNGEFLPLSGGAYLAEDHAGVYFTGLTYPRTHNYKLAGFRSVYVKHESE